MSLAVNVLIYSLFIPTCYIKYCESCIRIRVCVCVVFGVHIHMRTIVYSALLAHAFPRWSLAGVSCWATARRIGGVHYLSSCRCRVSVLFRVGVLSLCITVVWRFGRGAIVSSARVYSSSRLGNTPSLPSSCRLLCVKLRKLRVFQSARTLN